jgi:hypothetical protein
LRFGSVCSGIDAASVAWEPLGWQASFFSEIDKFPRAVLAHHFQKFRCMATSQRLKQAITSQLTFLSEEPPASPSRLPEGVSDWMTRAATSPSSIALWLAACAPAGSFGRMSPASCHRTEDGILVPSSGSWANAGMGGPTECSTLNMSEWTALPAQFPSDDGVCSLLDILETGDVPQRHFLSPKVCGSILRRADDQGADLPCELKSSLNASSRLQ